jgi:hypothetical protein
MGRLRGLAMGACERVYGDGERGGVGMAGRIDRTLKIYRVDCRRDLDIWYTRLESVPMVGLGSRLTMLPYQKGRFRNFGRPIRKSRM